MEIQVDKIGEVHDNSRKYTGYALFLGLIAVIL